MGSSKTFFLNLDVGAGLAGIEASGLARSKAFEAAGLESAFTTIYYNPQLHRYADKWKKAGRASKDVEIVGMYDFFQGVTGDYFRAGLFAENSDFAPYRVAEVPDTPDLRLYDNKGDFIAYCKRDPEDKQVLFINYLHAGRIYRRETYDSRGFLSRIDQLEPNGEGEIGIEVYFRPDGTHAIIKRVNIANGISSAHSISILDPSGRQIAMFESDDQMVEYWLEQLVAENPDAAYVVDRTAEHYAHLQKAILKNKANAKVIPVVHSVHTAGDVLAGEINNFYRTVFNDVNQPTALVVFTEEQKNDIISRMGDCEVRVIPHSGQGSKDLPEPESRDPKRIVYPARYSVEKHHEQAIEAFKLVLEKVPDAELHFYGFGLERDKVELMIKEQDVANNVFAHDFEVDVAKVFHSASASILTSGVEAFCLAVMESLFNGCPVVSFDIKYGPSTMIRDGVNGYLVPGGDVVGMAEKLVQILTDEKLRIELSRNCEESMHDFTHEAIGKKWKALLSN